VSPGAHSVILHFADIYEGTAGQNLRKFDVFVHEELVLEAFDIVAEVGWRRATTRMFAITVALGESQLEVSGYFR